MTDRIISVSEMESGMELTEPIKNGYGQILLNRGLILQEKHKLMLKTWGIKRISIKSETVEIESPITGFSDDNLAVLGDMLSWKPRNYQETELIQLALIFNQNRRL